MDEPYAQYTINSLYRLMIRNEMAGELNVFEMMSAIRSTAAIAVGYKTVRSPQQIKDAGSARQTTIILFKDYP